MFHAVPAQFRLQITFSLVYSAGRRLDLRDAGSTIDHLVKDRYQPSTRDLRLKYWYSSNLAGLLCDSSCLLIPSDELADFAARCGPEGAVT